MINAAGGPNRRLLVNASSIVDEAGAVVDWVDWKLFVALCLSALSACEAVAALI